MTIKLEHLSELNSKLKTIKNMGFVESLRFGPTGIGKTLETLFGKKEDNLAKADFYNIEIKGKRKKSNSLLSLFTKAPSFPEDANSYLVEKYGVLAGDNKRLSTTVSAKKFNSFKKKYSFKLEIDKLEEKIYIIIKNFNSEKILDRSIGYDFSSLKEIFEDKIKYLLLGYAESKKGTLTKEVFYFYEFFLYKEVNFDRFIELLEEGTIKLDIRIGKYPNGKVHDHGTAFRINPNHLFLLYKNFEKLNI